MTTRLAFEVVRTRGLYNIFAGMGIRTRLIVATLLLIVVGIAATQGLAHREAA